MLNRKRSWAAAGLLALFAVPVLAQLSPVIVPKLEQSDLTFAFRRVVGGFGRTLDSSATATADNSPTSAKIDTTEAFRLAEAHYRGPYGWWRATAGNLVADSIWAWGVTLTSATGDTITGSDSNLTTVQISSDGVVWTSLDTLGINTRLKFDLNANGSARADLYTTCCGIGTDRINWDKATANFVRFIHLHDVGVTTNRRMFYSIHSRRYP